MKLYSGCDVLKTLIVFSAHLGKEFFSSEGEKNILTDIFYVEEEQIKVNDKAEKGFLLFFYFENNAAIGPALFYKLNNIEPVCRAHERVLPANKLM